MTRNASSHARPGTAYVVAIVLLAVFIAIAAAFESVTGLNARTSGNTAHLQRARLAAEGGLVFATNLLRRTELPPDTDGTNVIARLAQALAQRLEATANLAGGTVTHDATTVYVPAIATDHGRFELRVVRADDGGLTMEVRGASDLARHGVAIDLSIVTDPGNSAFNYGIAARGPIALGGNAEIRGMNDLTEASVISLVEQGVAVSISGDSVIDGDISSVGDETSVTIDGTPTVAGSQDPTVIAEHIHFGVPSPVFPTVDTSIFKPLATTVIDDSTDTGQHGLTFDNPIIKAGTNPNFASDVVLNGVVYVEAPNIVTFSGKVTLNGLVATDDTDLGIESCKLSFAAQVEAYGVAALPDTPEFEAVKALTGTFILAPGFDVNFAGQFTTINGTIAADKLTFSGQASGTVEGSVLGLSEHPVSIDGTVNICIDRSGDTGDDAGFSMPVVLDVSPQSYREIVVGGGQ